MSNSSTDAIADPVGAAVNSTDPVSTDPVSTGRDRRTFGQALLLRPNMGGLLFALLFWWESLSPTLLSRTAIAQGMISAVCIGFGYMVGTLLGYWGHRLLARLGRAPSASTRQIAWRASLVLGIVVVVLGIIVWPRWQNEQRDLLTLAHISRFEMVPALIVTAILVAILGLIGRLVWRGFTAIDRLLMRLVPGPAAVLLTTVVVVLLGNVLATRVVAPRLHSWANSAFGVLEDDTDEGTVQPTSSAVTGGPGSLIPWAELGREGRNFVARATTKAQLEGFHGVGKVTAEPVRVYVGLRSGNTAQERAALAVRELDRTHAWDQKVLVVATVTGTGWVDPDAATAIEQLYAGDTAMVGQQYSFLPSWISTLVDGQAAKDAGAALFAAVHARWLQIPAASRPKLLMFGQSLGSFGGEAAFTGHDARTSVDNFVALTDGALLTGPTNDNAIWGQVTAARSPGSPAWRPVYDDGTSVRFANKPSEVLEPDPTWVEPRILYIQHPSDPVTFWSMDTLWSRPEWIESPTGYDVPDRATWFPFVTWAQGVADLSAGFGAKPGFGHDYRNAFVAGWAAVLAPTGWTSADTTRLEAYLGRN